MTKKPIAPVTKVIGIVCLLSSLFYLSPQDKSSRFSNSLQLNGSEGVSKSIVTFDQNLNNSIAGFSSSEFERGVISGKIFNDANFNGNIDKGEAGVLGVQVLVYDKTNKLVAKASADKSGDWAVRDLNDAEKYRVEFSVPEKQKQLVRSTPKGLTSGPAVQFAKPNTKSVNYGIYEPSKFVGDKPFLITPCYIGGDSDSEEDAVVRWGYGNTGLDALDKKGIAKANQVGSLWGTAYNPHDAKVYTAATLKRHVGLFESEAGGGLGAIFTIDPYSQKANAKLWLQLQDIKIAVGNIPSNQERGLSEAPNHDVAAFSAVGKVGIGGVKVSEDGKTLFAMNLFDKKVYGIDIASKSVSQTYTIPDPGCTNGESRPWALGIRNGKLYAGLICDGSSNVASPPNVADKSTRPFLHAYVYELQAEGSSLVLDFPLDYLKEPPFSYGNGGCLVPDGWYGWVDEMPVPCDGQSIGYPQPILSDLDWDDNDNMILAFTDRSGLQIGHANYGLSGEELYYLFNSGDLLHACSDGADKWNIENPTSCANAQGGAIGGDNKTYPAFIFSGNPNYPNAGEFFVGDFFQDGGTLMAPGWMPAHGEIALGGIAVLPGENEVVATSYDPVTSEGGLFNRGGVIKLSTTTGTRTVQGYQLYDTDGANALTFGKGTGLGDLELITGRPQAQVGIYLWNDTDEDGLQGSEEAGLANVNVQLVKGDQVIATAQADEEGYVYFSSKSISRDANWLGTGIDTAIISGVDYKLKIAKTQAMLSGFTPTTLDVSSNSQDLLDSDGEEEGDSFSVPFQILEAGTVQHSLAMGLIGEEIIIDPPSGGTCSDPATPGINVSIDCSNLNSESIAGLAFNDLNANGSYDLGEESGLSGIIVNLYDDLTSSTAPVSSTNTDSDGEYLFLDLSLSQYRIEFVIPEDYYCGYKVSMSGTSNGTAIQYVQSGTCASIGYYNPAEYCGPVPLLITPCYIGGNSTGTADIVVRWSYDNTGVDVLDKTTITTENQAGSLWGMAYDKNTASIYSSAVLKRHVGLHEGDDGGGLDAIYLLDPLSNVPNAEVWLELEDDLGISVGTIPSNTDRGLDAIPNYDTEAFGKIGKVGIGDVEFNAADTTLYVMNLFDKTLYHIHVPTKTLIGSYPVPDPGCSNGTYRPWGIGLHNDAIYVGSICDGSDAAPSPPTHTDASARQFLKAFVYELDAGTFGEVLSFDLDYAREPTFFYGGTCNLVDGWLGWVDEFPVPCQDGVNVSYPQPILTDIEWDDEGDMLLGFMDRSAMQIGAGNYGTDGVSTSLHAVYSGGDILHACAVPDQIDSWVIEADGTSCQNTTGEALGGVNMTYASFIPQVPGEFFVGDFFSDGGDLNTGGWFPGHAEIAIGALAVLPGTNEVVSTAYDPVTAEGGLYLRGGVIKLDTRSGRRSEQGYQLYDSNIDNTTFGKGAGLGDIEIVCTRPQIEIGNYVWFDENKNGLHDSNELGLDGVTVQLFRKEQLVATTATADGGKWYFSSASKSGDVNWLGTGVDTSIMSNVEYAVRIVMDQDVIAPLNLTSTDVNGDANDAYDNDAIAVSGNADILVTVPEAGCTNHTLAFGFVPKPPDVAVSQVLDPDFDITNLNYGDPVKFKITVFNQSSMPVDSLEITDYLPAGYAFDSGLTGNEQWATDANGNPTAMLTDVILGDDKDSLCIFLILKNVEEPKEWINVVEISNAWTGGEEIIDGDSPLNNDPLDNVGSEINTPADDYILGDGTATEIDGLAATDQDNVDPATVPVCDLALTNKIVSLIGIPKIGDTVKYEIVVFNQGNTIANTVSVDYQIPAGFDYLEINDSPLPSWTQQSASLASITTQDALAPGVSDTICIYLELDNVETEIVSKESWTTIAEITSFTDEEGATKLQDVDSTPDSDPTNDSGGNPDDATDNETDGDGSGDPQDPAEDSDPALDEDDHDPAKIYVSDIATIVAAADEAQVSYGDTVKYIVEVHNQGNEDITAIDIQNLFGKGLEYVEDETNGSEGWVLDDADELSLLIEETLEPGEIDTICLNMKVVMSENPTEESWLQNLEVVSFEDPDNPGESKEDIDSTPDDDPTNDPGGNPHDATDDETDGDGSGDLTDLLENSDPSKDEDDQDTEDIEICDLALINQLVEVPESVEVGDTIKFEVVIFNQGNTIANTANIDYLIPNGLSYIQANGTQNPAWTEENLSLASITTDKVLAAGESDTVCISLKVENVSSELVTADSWTTLAEITSFTDEEGEVKLEDADSTPDDDFVNDSGGNPDDETDNVIAGDGSGDATNPAEDSDPALDEDDHDAAIVEVSDVATIIYTADEGPYSYGDTIKYTVEVYNQGNTDITDVDLQNLFGEGLEYVRDEANGLAGWVLDEEGELSLLIDETLEPGEVDSVCLNMKIVMSERPTEESWLQNVEVVSFEDPKKPGESKEDVDSTPDDDPTNDPGGNPDSATDDVTDGDGSGDFTDPIENDDPALDEDDQDTEDIEIYDLALVNKIVSLPTPPMKGDTVKYEVVIYNQGNAIANSVDINYLIPNGLSYLDINDNSNPEWSEESRTLASITMDEVLAPGESDTVFIFLGVEDLITEEATVESWVTIAEITSFTNEEGEVKLEDVDSTPDEDFTNDSGGNPHDETDNETRGDGSGNPKDLAEDSNPALDEDDHDATDIFVCDVAAIIDTEDVGPFSYGDTVKYFVEVHNQGNGDITNIALQNLFGEGLSYIDNAENSDAGWRLEEEGKLSLIVDEVIATNDTTIVCLEMEVVPVREVKEGTWLQNLEVVRFEDPAEPGVAKSDVDSTPDDNPDNDSGGNADDSTDDSTSGDGSGNPEDPIADMDPALDEDDQDVEEIAVFDLALRKTVENEGPYKVGETVEFDIHIYNQGNVDASSIEITDYLSGGFAFATENNGWVIDGELLRYAYDDVLVAGEKDSIKLYLVTQVDGDPDIADWYNYAEISAADDDTDSTNTPPTDADSNPDDVQDDNGGRLLPDTDNNDEIHGNSLVGEDEDDHDVEKVIVGYDLRLEYVALDTVPMNYGDTILYNIILANEGGLTVTDIELSDTLPAGLIFPPDINSEWQKDDGRASLLIEDPLAPGYVMIRDLKLIVNQVETGGAEEYLSIIEIVSFKDEDGEEPDSEDYDSTPDSDPKNDLPEEDDHDMEDLKVFDLAIQMKLDSMPPVIPVIPGDVMKFNVIIHNQGNVVANDVEITNYIMPENLKINRTSLSEGWSAIDDSKNKYLLEDPIAPGDVDTVSVFLEVVNGAMADIITSSEISGSRETDEGYFDIDSTPNDVNGDDIGGMINDLTDDRIDDDGKDYDGDGVTDEDDHDSANLQVQDLALIVWADQADPVVPNQDVTFKMKVTNQGNITNHNIKLMDYMPRGYELSANDTNGWVAEGSSNYSKVITEPLYMGEEVEASIVLTVKEGVNTEDLINAAEIVSSEDSQGVSLNDREVDSNPDAEDDNDPGGEPSDLVDNDDSPNIIGDDNNIDGSGINGEDEDDQDSAPSPTFDLATIIYTDQTTPVIPGDEIEFLVDIHNQGNMAAQDVELSLYMPDGFVLSENDDALWEVSPDGNLSNIVKEDILPVQRHQLSLLLRVNEDFVLEDLMPEVEISGASDTLGINRDEFDLDSSPDGQAGNDAGGLLQTENDDELYGNGLDGSDEDDHDPVVPPVLDLAIKMEASDRSAKQTGDVVEFMVNVYNQGNVTPAEFTIEDYVPEGLVFAESPGNSRWKNRDGQVTYQYTEDLLPQTSDSLSIWLEVSELAHPENVVNMVEIIEVVGEFNIDISSRDIDSQSDSDNTNDKGNEPYSAEASKLRENGRSGNDEDDHDQAFLLICNPMVCVGQVNLSLDDNCEATLSASMFMEGPIFPDRFYDFYIVDQIGNETLVSSFDFNDVGNTYKIKIDNPSCENSCWGNVLVESKFAPVLDCTVGIDTISCIELAVFDGPPLSGSGTSGCFTTDVSIEVLNEQVINVDACEGDLVKKVIRQYQAVDVSGGRSNICTQELHITRLDPSLIKIPVSTAVNLSCGAEIGAIGDEDIAIGVVPFYCPLTGSGTAIDPIPLYPAKDNFCNILVEYTDEVIVDLPCKKQVLRRWEIRQWHCNDEDVINVPPQLLTLLDEKPPEVICPTDTIVVSTSGSNCTARVLMPEIGALDSCNVVSQIDMSYPGGFVENKNGGEIGDIPVGLNAVTYIAYDACGNSSSCRVHINVVDNSPPVIICEKHIQVSITNTGDAHLPATVFDDGSYDDCGRVVLTARRMDLSCQSNAQDSTSLEFREYVKFCCGDVGTVQMVALKVTDRSGRENQCMVEVTVVDKNPPALIGPPDITVSCEFVFDNSDLSIFGSIATSEIGRQPIVIEADSVNIDGSAFDGLMIGGCGVEIVEEVDMGNVSSCGTGSIERMFSVSANGSTVTDKQTITVVSPVAFDPDRIVWPRDTSFYNKCTAVDLHPDNLPAGVDRPRLGEGVCELIGASITNEQIFSADNDGLGCVKVFRQWSIINWCDTDVLTGLPARWDSIQTIGIENRTAPIISSCIDTAEVYNSFDANCNLVSVNLSATATDDCTALDDLSWTWTIDQDSNGTIDTTGAGSEVNAAFIPGTHQIVWYVEDLCGNISAPCTQYFEITNSKAAPAICLDHVVTDLVLMDTDSDGVIDTEMVEIWATDVVKEDSHPCGHALSFSFDQLGLQDNIIFSCGDLGFNSVMIYVTDLTNGAQSSCWTEIEVQDNNDEDVCSGLSGGSGADADVSGLIHTESGVEISETQVKMLGSQLPSFSTDFNGQYAFNDMPMGGDYTIIPSKDINHINGVSTLDLVLIQKHILGLELLDSPYKMLAADINKSNSITASDLVQLRRLILGITDSFENNESWRFVDELHLFDVPTNPWATVLPEYYDIYNLSTDMIADFVGVKIGDVTGNAKGSELITSELRTSSDPLSFIGRVVQEGVFKVVEISSKDFINVNGFQTTISFDVDDYEFIKVDDEVLDVGADNVGTRYTSKGMLTLSWSSELAVDASSQDVLFKLYFRPKGSEPRRIELTSNSEITTQEAYFDGKITNKIDIEILEESNIGMLLVDQNEPNPWRESTMIGFKIPDGGQVQLRLYDTTGKLIREMIDTYGAGHNEITVGRDIISRPGIYLYEIQYKEQVEYKRMVVLN